MQLTKEAIEELNKSCYNQYFTDEIIKKNGETDEIIYVGEYKGFHLFESTTDEESFALNSKHYEQEGFNIDSYDGIDEVKSYIDDAIEDYFNETAELVKNKG